MPTWPRWTTPRSRCAAAQRGTCSWTVQSTVSRLRSILIPARGRPSSTASACNSILRAPAGAPPPEAMKTLLVDDERLARNELRRLLAAHADIEIVGEAVDVPDALAKVGVLKPELIFLDVQM